MVDRHIAQYTPGQSMDTGGGKRHMAITSRGVVWFGHRYAGNLMLYAAPAMTDPAQQPGDSSIMNGVLTCAGEWSMCIDEKDNVHVVYAKYAGAAGDGRTDKATIMYRHGVLSASHTGITWSVEVAVTGYDFWHSPDVVAHYSENVNQVYAHVVCAYNWSGDNRTILYYWRCRTNSGDSVNHVVEAGFYLQDIVSSQTFVPKPSIEMRHEGDGKTPYRNPATGVAEPDIFVTWTAVQRTYAARIAFTGVGAGWATSAQVWLVNPSWGNNTSSGGYGGLYEHHRWTQILYDRRDDRIIVVGWMSTAGVARQALALFEVAARGPTTNLVEMVFDGRAGSGVIMDWGVDAASESAVSGTATLTPDSDIEMISTGGAYGTPWYSAVNRRRISRPTGSNLRTAGAREEVQGGASLSANCDILPYPPGGEHHVLYWHSNTWIYYWRNNRGCPFVMLGARANLVQNPTFQTGIANWAESGNYPGVVAHVAGQGIDGGYVLCFAGPGYVGADDATTMTVTPGTTIILSASARLVGDPSHFRLTDAASLSLFNPATGLSIGAQPIVWSRSDLIGEGFVRKYRGYVVPAGVTQARMRAYVGDAMASSGEGIYFDQIMLEEAPTLRDYFDGSVVGGKWAGTAHASASYLFGVDVPNPAAVRRPKYRLRLDGFLVPEAARVPAPAGIPATTWDQLPESMTWDSIPADVSWDEL